MSTHHHRLSSRQLVTALTFVVLVLCSLASPAFAVQCNRKNSTSSATPSAPAVTTTTPTVTTTSEPGTDAPVSTEPETLTPMPTEPETLAPEAAGSASEEVEGEASLDGSTASSPSSSSTSSSTPSTATGGESFGTITSTGSCVTGNPTEYISTEYLDWIWTNRMAEYVPDFKNFIFDQLMNNDGKLSYCVRWDSTDTLTKTEASKFEAMLNRQFKAWNKWLIGYGCWPFDTIEAKIVGFAVRDASVLDWSDDSLGKIYEGIVDSDGVPQCPESCYKHLGQAVSADTSACTGTPFDMSLWPTKDMGGGAGGDWGQRVDEDGMLSTIDQDELVVVAHEIGHGFGLPDFYATTDKPGEDMPAMIMEAGASMTVTPGDGWMLRRVWENIRSRYSSTSG